MKLSFKLLLLLLGFGLTAQAQFTCPVADYNPGNNPVQNSRYYPNIAVPTAYKEGKITCTFPSSPSVIPLISAVKINGIVQTNIIVGGPSNVFYVGTGKTPGYKIEYLVYTTDLPKTERYSLQFANPNSLTTSSVTGYGSVLGECNYARNYVNDDDKEDDENDDEDDDEDDEDENKNTITIGTQPVGGTICLGSSKTFSVTASVNNSNATLNYQWRKNGVDITGATNSSYTISQVAAGDAANYDVRITLSCSTSSSNGRSILSSTVALNVVLAPSFQVPGARTIYTSSADCGFDAHPSITGYPSQVINPIATPDSIVNNIVNALSTTTTNYHDDSIIALSNGVLTFVRNWTVTNGCPINVTKTQQISIADTNAPVVKAKDITIQLDSNGSVSITANNIDNGSSDACGIASMRISQENFNCSHVGPNAVTLTVTDINGNTASANAIVTVQDLIAPHVVTKNLTIQLNAYGNATITPSDVNNGSTDNCGISDLILSKTSFDCANVGPNTVTLTVYDVNGNSASANAVVTVKDEIAPVVNTQNITLYLNASGNASTTAAAVNNGSTDACGIANMSLSKTNFDCSNVGANNVTLTVTDVNGNSSNANAVVTVVDNVNPTAICKNATVTLSNGLASITSADVNNGSNDACGIATLSVSPSSFTCANIGNNNVVLTVTDVNGNVSTCNAVVQVMGSNPTCSLTSSPRNNGTVIGSTTTLAPANTLYLGYGAQTMNLTCTATGGAPFTYSWTGSNLSASNIANPVFAPTVGGNYSFTCTVTNSYGCQTTCSIVICVLDVRSPGCTPANPKVYLCHVPSGNPTNTQTLNISISAVPAHLGTHTGDRLGSCAQTCGSLKNGGITGDLYSEGEIDLIVYPNPSSASFTFKLESASNEPIQIAIFDINGRLISDTQFTNNATQMIVGEDLANGLYFAHVKQGDFNKTIKIQKTF